MKQRAPLIAAGASLLVVLLVVFLLVLPKVSAIHKANDDLAAARATQTQLQAHLEQLKATEAQAKQIRTELSKLSAAVPPTVALPDLIRTLNDLADAAGVDFLTLAPGQPSAVEGAPGTLPGTAAPVSGALPVGVSVVPVSVTLEGSYFSVDEYLFRLETLPRISKVNGLTLGIGTGGYPQLALSFQANFYTTDTSAGPGSQPGSQGAAAPQGSPLPTPSPSATT
jgi:Tfp pilus assembly protein PilO